MKQVVYNTSLSRFFVFQHFSSIAHTRGQIIDVPTGKAVYIYRKTIPLTPLVASKTSGQTPYY